MTLADLNGLMVTGVSRTDITANGSDDYSSFLNEAQRAICQRRSFKWMRTSADLTIPAGDVAVTLPENFKELTKGRTPVVQVDSSQDPEVLTPVDVWTLEKQQRRGMTAPFLTVRLDTTTDPPQLALLASFDTDVDLRVSYYAFPDDLVEDGDENRLTVDHPHMLLNKAKALAFASVNDATTRDFEELFESQFKVVAGFDAYSSLSGTVSRM